MKLPDDAMADAIRTAQATYLELAPIAKGNGAEAARRSAIRRVDDLLASSTRRSGARPACAAGCSWCCHLQVAVTPPEVLGLIDYLKSALSAEEFGAFATRVRGSAEVVAAMTADQHMHTNVPCPVLQEGHCQGYAARPIKCRTFHSLDSNNCEASYNEPHRDDVNIPKILMREVHGDAALDAYVTALAAAGFDSAKYELISAIAEALDDRANIDARLRGRERVFRNAVQLAPAKAPHEIPPHQ